MRKVGICTVYTGYNYGSALQAYATKQILGELGYSGDVLKLAGSIVSGRDVRIKKIVSLGINMLVRFKQTRKMLRTYTTSRNKVLTDESKKMFVSFYQHQIEPVMISEFRLKKVAKSNKYIAFLCGSDQIWNSTTYYVDPFYYLDFAPRKKRVAFAPSFGRDYIPKYNRKRIMKKIQGIDNLSVREESGKVLIREFVDKDVKVLIDPTLVLDKKTWCNLLGLTETSKEGAYVFAYFLDEPSEYAKEVLKAYSKLGYKILSGPYEREGDWFDSTLNGGPREFLQFVLEADAVCTDSFHGVAFSLNFEKNFYAFERKYGNAANQSSRLISLLGKVDLLDRFNPKDASINCNIDYSYCRRVLSEERKKSKQYLSKILYDLEEKND